MQALIDLSIREGDVLTVDGRNYPVKVIETYQSDLFRGGSFERMAQKTARITRKVPSGADYVESVIAENIPCTHLDPVSAGAKNTYREVLGTPTAILQTFIASPNGFYKLIVEDLKK